MIGNILRLLDRFVRYFWGNNDYDPTRDPKKIAHFKIQMKIRQIEELSRYRDEKGCSIFVAQGPIVRAEKKLKIVTQGLSSVVSKFTIELDEYKSKSNMSFGKITKKYDVTVISCENVKTFMRELTYLQKLRSCDYFLSLLFTIDDSNKFIMESYSSTLTEYNEQFNPCDAVKQISSGLHFLHNNLNIAHLQFTKDNIVVVSQPMLRFKIMNFSKAEKTNDIELFRRDVLALGQLTNFIYFIKKIYRKKKLTLYEKSLVTDLIEKLSDGNNIQPLTKLIKHPCFYSAKDTLNFIVKVCRFLEDDKQLNNYINEQLEKGLGTNWRQTFLNNNPKETYDALEIYSLPFWRKDKNVWLVRKIRNLVVHKRSIEVRNALNVTNETEFLNFWTDQFPFLIIELYNSFQMCNT